MAQFSYTAVNRNGERIKGVTDAPNESEVRVFLRSQNLRPVRITRPSAFDLDLAKLPIFAAKVKPTDLILFTRQLSILIAAGVPLVQGLDAIATQASNTKVKSIVLNLKEKVTSGTFLWEAMKPHKEVFPELYVNMVRAGEASGALDGIFKRLLKYMEDADKLKKLIKGAMIYPIAITIVGLAVLILMMVFVIPKFEELLKGAGQELPEITQFVINMSRFFQNNIWLILGGLVGSFYAFSAYKKTEEGKAFIDHYILSVPVFGPIVLKVSIARFARTLQTLLVSGVSLMDSFEIVGKTIGNKRLEAEVKKMQEGVSEGKTLSAIMSRSPLFPSMVIQMLTVGESTGNIDKMLERIAEFYEEDVQNLVNNMTKMIEPFVLVFLGGMVGGLMIAMYLPIFKMAGGAG
jgi:type IV pilus assembly protein PilC